MPTRLRLNICVTLCLFVLAPLSARLANLQILRHQNLSSRAENATVRHALELTPRGRILDREGRVLAESLPAWSSTLDFNGIKDPLPLARQLSKLIAVDPAILTHKIRSGKRWMWLKRKMTLDEVSQLKNLKLSAVGFLREEIRTHPNGELAQPILGTVNLEGQGSSGLEYTFHEALSGKPRRIQWTRDGAGQAIVQDPVGEDAAPPDLRLTIDRTIQFFAESELKEAVLRHRARSGSILVQDPRNGEILAMALYPSNALRNGVVQDVYEPGSTFKIVVLAAALEKNLFSSSDKINCELGRWEISPSVVLRDHEPKGPLSLDEILIHSSNIGMAKLGLKLGASDFLHFCRLFGFGYKTGIPLPGESAGMVKPLAAMDKIRLANNAFGQGLAITPLQLINAYSAVANGGDMMEPKLVLAMGEEPIIESRTLRRIASAETTRKLQKMLERVVTEGTGASAQVPGYRVAGKTGTAQKIDPGTGRYSSTEYVSSFIGYAPAQDPKFTILVVLDSPKEQYYAAEVAAPVFSRLCRKLLALRGVAADTALPVKLPSAPLPRPSILQTPKKMPVR